MSSLTKLQKDKIINSLKTGKLMGGGQSLNILSNVADAWNEDVSKFLQELKRKRLVTYFSTNRVWYWNNNVETNELFK